ncbi:MAG TPA: 4-(cytidine 5'-diphospho)-2-C-methyl-D-erythritol kinase [Granulicella sp.]|nr:4-(cytidine 5'-diphospho)-2-C-methyl-D-erythritol kinase [Granulicella sp.]
MPTRVRSHSKINLGLAIGPPRPDGFHHLATLYQTLALYDVVTISATRAAVTAITLTSNHPGVPTDGRNTAWRMVERCLDRLEVQAEVHIHIQKELPVQGGMGAGSANAAAALLGLERELDVALSGVERLELAASVGSDVPLFLLGGAVLGQGRGEQVSPLPDLPETPCVIALPAVGVSTPQAFRDWDALQLAAGGVNGGLTDAAGADRLDRLSLALASTYAEPGTSGIFCASSENLDSPEKKQGRFDGSRSNLQNDLAENTLLALVRTGIENDFERVVFPIHPPLREIKRQLMGVASAGSLQPGVDADGSALYAALSGSGSALFGLYPSIADAQAAQRRVQAIGVKAVITHTLPRAAYWRTMFAG